MVNLLLVLAVITVLAVRVTPTRLEPGQTRQFDYNGDRYWIFIDWWGTVNYQKAVDDCKTLHDAEVTDLYSDDQYQEIQNEVEGAIPGTWSEVMLWTNESDAANTNVMLVIWRPGTGGPNKKMNLAPSYSGHGYICRKQMNTPGTTYEFQYDHDDYWFNIDWWGTYNLSTSEAKCAEHDAKLVQIIDQAQLNEIERQVKYRIPTTWHEVMLWTADSAQPGTNEMLVIWRQGTGGPDRKVNKPPSYKGHGYVCQKKTNAPGTTYSYEFDGKEYYFYINFWGGPNYADAVTACAGHGATVASAADAAVYAEMQKQIEYRIPLTWRDVVMWTSDSKSAGTHVMIVVFRDDTGTDNRGSKPDSYRGHGYVCSKTL